MKEWLHKWLPIFFGCHCKEERSLYYKGQKFPICARCTGELVGMLVSMFSCFFFLMPVWLLLLILIPMIVDGVIQMMTTYESNNRRRFITGFFFGYGIIMLFVTTSIMAFNYGMRLTVE